MTFLINTAQIWPGGTCSTLSWRQLRFPQSTRRGSWTVQGNTSATHSGLESWIVGLWLMLLWTGKLFLSWKSKNLKCMRSTSKLLQQWIFIPYYFVWWLYLLWAAKFSVKICNIFSNANKSIEHIFTNVFTLSLFETYAINYKNAKNRIEKKM